jgi:flagellar basal-body rod protein FlgG
MSVTGLFISNTGLQAASRFLDVTSNNLANSSTPGFKTAQVTFQDLLYSEFAAGGVPGATQPSGNQLGFGTAVDAIGTQFTQGTLTPTGQQFDLAITGRGLFAVTLPDGTTGYTRAGNFLVNANGQLVTPDGFLLAGGITVPPNASSVSVGPTGLVTAVTPGGTVQLGQLQLTDFQNPGGLLRVGNNTFTAGPNAGAPTTGNPGTGGLGTLSQGFLEQSNVDLVSELTNLLIAQRTFSFNSQAIQVESATLQATLDLIH